MSKGSLRLRRHSVSFISVSRISNSRIAFPTLATLIGALAIQSGALAQSAQRPVVYPPGTVMVRGPNGKLVPAPRARPVAAPVAQRPAPAPVAARPRPQPMPMGARPSASLPAARPSMAAAGSNQMRRPLPTTSNGLATQPMGGRLPMPTAGGAQRRGSLPMAGNQAGNQAGNGRARAPMPVATAGFQPASRSTKIATPGMQSASFSQSASRSVAATGQPTSRSPIPALKGQAGAAVADSLGVMKRDGGQLTLYRCERQGTQAACDTDYANLNQAQTQLTSDSWKDAYAIDGNGNHYSFGSATFLDNDGQPHDKADVLYGHTMRYVLYFADVPATVGTISIVQPGGAGTVENVSLEAQADSAPAADDGTASADGTPAAAPAAAGSDAPAADAPSASGGSKHANDSLKKRATRAAVKSAEIMLGVDDDDSKK
jgi:hypothetical protein